MPRFRAVIKRIEISHEVVECTSASIDGAVNAFNRYLNGKRRGITIVRAHDADSNATTEDRVKSISEHA